MDKEQRVAFINSQIACALIEAQGMQAENLQRMAVGSSLAYTEQDFQNVINKYGIHHNAVIGYLMEY